ncbi:MAG: PadR family transcriptional regulator [Fimbriimonadaceae bacterium]
MSYSGPYSELEYMILAMVGDNVNSGYAMRKQMNRMRGGRWSSESGSVYRVLRRLEQDLLLREARRVGVPNRERTEYELTPQGEAVLQSWLIFPPDRGEFAMLVDPLRTRAFFLGRLRLADQLKIVKNWMAENKQLILELEREVEAEKPVEAPIKGLALQNLLCLAQARQEWLKKVAQMLRGGVPAPDCVESGKATLR